MKIQKQKAITLIALVITIVILLILAGISISTLGGENGLIQKAKIAKKLSMKSEMNEQLILALTELQLEKTGEATLDDVTQEWAEKTLKKYEPLVINDASISGKKITMSKGNIVVRYMIDEKLNIVEKEESDSSIEFSYKALEIEDGNVNILISVRDRENGITKIQLPDGREILTYGTKDEKTIDYKVEIGKEYKIKIISESGEEKEEIILIENYWFNITKKLDEGVTLDNSAIKAEYNKTYETQITAKEDYVIYGLTVTMGGQAVTTSGNNIVDINTGKIYIEKVTGNIEIIVNCKKIEITITEPYIGTSKSITDSSQSVEDNSQTKGNSLYINFKMTTNLEGVNYSIEPTVPYAITENGTYKFTITATYGSYKKIIEKEVNVNKYTTAKYLVKYNAGEWTKEEIEKLKSLSLYYINTEQAATYSNSFTFGGFSYKDDTENLDYINNGRIVTNRNQSVIAWEGYGTTRYDGWQILEIKDSDGNIITLESEIDTKMANLKNEKIYVTKLIHAGATENFSFRYATSWDASRAEYILSGGLRMTDYNTYNPRDWSIYIDKNQSNLIDNVHIMTYEEAYNITENRNDTNGIRNIGSRYWTSTIRDTWYGLWAVNPDGYIENDSYAGGYGIRPVVTLKDGVYISSGDGTAENEFVLAME